jgi:FkbM family methyltransferase
MFNTRLADKMRTIASVWRQTKRVEAVRALYSRLHSNALRPNDTIPFAEARFDDMSSFAAKVHGFVEELDKVLPGFRDTYDVFRAFAPDSVVLDVGAHWGYSVAAMRHQGCRSKIISIEAMATNAASLNALKTIENGRYDWINVALDSDEGTLTFHVPVVNGTAVTGLASTGRTLDDHGANFAAGMAKTYPPKKWGAPDEFRLATITVRATPLDNILYEYGGIVDKVVAVKIDIEGHEYHALCGASKLLSYQRPLLMLEGANRNTAVTGLLADQGYFHCERRRDGRLVPHLVRSCALDGFFVHTSRVEEYRKFGIFEGETPTATERAVLATG